MEKKGESVFYAVKEGRKPGIYTNARDCQEQVIGFSGGKCQKFETREEAEKFIGKSAASMASTEIKTSTDQQPSDSKVTSNQKRKRARRRALLPLNNSVPAFVVGNQRERRFYAVRKGRKPGIYRTDKDYREQVDGFSNSESKRFSTREEAEAFLNGIEEPNFIQDYYGVPVPYPPFHAHVNFGFSSYPYESGSFLPFHTPQHSQFPSLQSTKGIGQSSMIKKSHSYDSLFSERKSSFRTNISFESKSSMVQSSSFKSFIGSSTSSKEDKKRKLKGHDGTSSKKKVRFEDQVDKMDFQEECEESENLSSEKINVKEEETKEDEKLSCEISETLDQLANEIKEEEFDDENLNEELEEGELKNGFLIPDSVKNSFCKI